MGRPLSLRRLVTVQEPDGLDAAGKPKTKESRKTLMEAIFDEMERTGHSHRACADAVAGCGPSSSYWWGEGRKLAEKAETCSPGWQPLERREQTYLAYFRGCQAAHARALSRLASLYDAVVSGGLTLSKVVQKVERQADGTMKVLEETVHRSVTLPDSLGIWRKLVVLGRDEGYAPRLELTGAEGGPIETADATEARARALLSEIASYEAGAADAREADEAVSRARDNGA